MKTIRMNYGTLPSRRSWTGTVLAAAAVLGLGSCQFAVDDITAPTWQPDILAPIAIASMDIEDLDQLAVFDASTYVTADNMGLLPGVVDGNTQQRSGVDVGPYTFDWLEDILGLDANEATVRLKIANDLPVDVAQGARMVVRQSGTGEAVISYDLSEELSAFGRLADSASFKGIAIASGLELWLEGLNITPVQGETIESTDGFQIDAQVELTGINNVDVASNAMLAFSDTTELSIDLIDDLDAYDMDGEFRLKVGNGFPFGGRLTAIFLAEDGVTALDNLSADPIEIAIPTVGGNGMAVESKETIISIPVDGSRLDMLQEAAYLGFEAEIFAPSSPDVLRASAGRSFDLQLIADFQFTIQP